jgi:hypothetical protein
VGTYRYLLIVYVFAGCVYWLWMAVGAWRVRRHVPVLADLPISPPTVWPRLSIVIPACNEAPAIRGAVESILAQDYPNLEIVLIDDRSTDETGVIIDRLAGGDFRILPIHVTSLPDGWLGKVHALCRGAKAATGEWMLLIDADVHLAPGTLRRAVAMAETRGLDHLAVTPDAWSAGLLVDSMAAMFLRTLYVWMRCWAIDDPQSSAFVGMGAFNLLRRSAFEQTPGFAWLRLEVADDLGVGLMLKRSGARTALAFGRGLVGLHRYRSLAEVARGSDKAFAPVGNCRLGKMLATAFFTVGLECCPVVAVLPLGVPDLWVAGLAMFAALATSVVLLRKGTSGRVMPGLLAPLGAVLSAAAMVRSGVLGALRGGVVWRGTLYPSRQLREGRRIRFL